MANKVYYSKSRNELQCYNKSVAVKAFKKGYDVYASKPLKPIHNYDDFKIRSVESIIDSEQALFIVENISMANLLDLEIGV